MSNGKHNDTPPGGNEELQVPEEEQQFADILREYGVGLKNEKFKIIARHITKTGGPDIYENPEALLKKLIEWSGDVDSTKRKHIIERWCVDKNLPVSEEVLATAEASAKELKAKGEKESREKDERAGRIWTLTEDGRPRVIKQGEMGMTRDELKAAMEDLYGEEPPTVFNETLQRYVVNPKSKVTARWPHIANTIAQEMNKAMVGEEPPDAVEIMIEQLAKFAALKEAMGVKETVETKRGEGDTVSSLVDALVKLDTLRGGKEGGSAAEMLELVLALQRFAKPDEGMKAIAAAFTAGLERMAPKEGETDEVKALRTELSSLRQTLADDRQKQLESQIGEVVKALGDVRQVVAEQQRSIERVRTEGVSKDEFSIMHEALRMADRRFGAIESVFRGWLSRPAVPLSEEERLSLTEGLKEVAKKEEGLDQLGKDLFG